MMENSADQFVSLRVNRTLDWRHGSAMRLSKAFHPFASHLSLIRTTAGGIVLTVCYCFGNVSSWPLALHRPAATTITLLYAPNVGDGIPDLLAVFAKQRLRVPILFNLGDVGTWVLDGGAIRQKQSWPKARFIRRATAAFSTTPPLAQGIAASLHRWALYPTAPATCQVGDRVLDLLPRSREERACVAVPLN
jgi:hypothetical protein